MKQRNSRWSRVIASISTPTALVIKLLDSRLDAAAAPEFKETVVSRIDAGEDTILLDLSAVDFIDSSGLGALVAVLKRISPSGKLVVCGLRDAAFNMFRLTRMSFSRLRPSQTHDAI